MSDAQHKQRRPIDLLPDYPYKAIGAAWQDVDLDYVMDELTGWFYMAVSCDKGAYEYADQRETFTWFYEDLLYLVEAMYFLYIKKDQERANKLATQSQETRVWLATINLPRRLDDLDAGNPSPVIQRFCSKYFLDYARIELWDFFESVGLYEGPHRNKASEASIFEFYIVLATLLEAGYLIAFPDNVK